MLGSQSLTFLLNRAAKSFRPSSNRQEITFVNKDEQKKTHSDHALCGLQKQTLIRSLDTLSISNMNDQCHHTKTNYFVIVANCGGCDCSTFICKLLKSTGNSIITDRQANVISFRIDNLVKNVTLVEVNFEKHDLWSTLDFDGCILLYSTRSSHSYKYAMKKLSQLRDLKEKCLLWLIGVVSDPASPSTIPRITSFEQAKAESLKLDARYWEVIPDGKTPRSPLVYYQIIMELISLMANSKIDFSPNKITFEFNKNPQVMRKVSKSCEYISFT
uniref:S-adenosyl-L-methionine-dependent methyltransferase n=1 Tax=Elaeophora elaphi TaxID=1147741 RepID=A0A0R3RX34_9BILA